MNAPRSWREWRGVAWLSRWHHLRLGVDLKHKNGQNGPAPNDHPNHVDIFFPAFKMYPWEWHIVFPLNLESKKNKGWTDSLAEWENMCRHIFGWSGLVPLQGKHHWTGLSSNKWHRSHQTKMVVAFRYPVYIHYLYIVSTSYIYIYTLYPLVDRMVTPIWPKTNLRSQILASKEISSLPFSWDSKKTSADSTWLHVKPKRGGLPSSKGRISWWNCRNWKA